jgi:hypothetical protein
MKAVRARFHSRLILTKEPKTEPVDKELLWFSANRAGDRWRAKPRKTEPYP